MLENKQVVEKLQGECPTYIQAAFKADRQGFGEILGNQLSLYLPYGALPTLERGIGEGFRRLSPSAPVSEMIETGQHVVDSLKTILIKEDPTVAKQVNVKHNLCVAAVDYLLTFGRSP